MNKKAFYNYFCVQVLRINWNLKKKRLHDFGKLF